MNRDASSLRLPDWLNGSKLASSICDNAKSLSDFNSLVAVTSPAANVRRNPLRPTFEAICGQRSTQRIHCGQRSPNGLVKVEDSSRAISPRPRSGSTNGLFVDVAACDNDNLARRSGVADGSPTPVNFRRATTFPYDAGACLDLLTPRSLEFPTLTSPARSSGGVSSSSVSSFGRRHSENGDSYDNDNGFVNGGWTDPPPKYRRESHYFKIAIFPQGTHVVVSATGCNGIVSDDTTLGSRTVAFADRSQREYHPSELQPAQRAFLEVQADSAQRDEAAKVRGGQSAAALHGYCQFTSAHRAAARCFLKAVVCRRR